MGLKIEFSMLKVTNSIKRQEDWYAYFMHIFEDVQTVQ